MSFEGQVEDGHPKSFLRACLLLLLNESPAHGYELLERLRDFAIERDPGGLYRTLRAMEHERLLASEWEPSYRGPDRRRYELTDAGRLALDECAHLLEDSRRTVDAYLARFERLRQSRELA